MVARAFDDQLVIRVSGGTGEGPTRLAAFDRALQAAGVADFNLVRLSSVIPPGARIDEVNGEQQLTGGIGDRLFCVYAAAYASTPAEEAWAGLIWAERTDAVGGGLFAEHDGSSKAAVSRDLTATMQTMIESRPGPYRLAGRLIRMARCESHPVCAVAIAAFYRSGWTA